MADNSVQTGADTIRDIDKGGVKTQVMVLDAGGSGAEALVSSSNPLPISLRSLSYPSSTNNSTIGQLAPGATFTGALETIVDQQAAQIEVTADQPLTLTLLQYADSGGVALTWAQSFAVVPGSPFLQNVTLPGNWFKLTVTNVGSGTTTTLRVDTTFGIMDTLPTTLTQQGNLRISINEVSGTAVAGTLPTTLKTDSSTISELLENMRAALAPNSSGSDGRGLADILDPLADGFVPIPTAPFGLEAPGEQPAMRSMPVAMATEQMVDQCYSVGISAVAVGLNLLTGNGQWLDASRCASVWIGISGTVSTGAYVVEGRNDDGAVIVLPFSGPSQASSPVAGNTGYTVSATTLVANSYIVIPALTKYIRLRVTTAVSGTVLMAAVRLSRIQPPPQMFVRTIVDGQASEAATAAGAPVRVGGYDGSLARTLKTNSNGNLLVSPDTTATGLTPIAINSAATTNATSTKASAGTLFSLMAWNNGAAAAFVKLFNKASAPTTGTDTPVYVLSVPAGGNASIPIDALVGYRLATGIGLAITNLAADLDNTAVAAGQVKVIGMFA